MTELFEVVNIETHNLCNRSCAFCKFGQQEKRKASYISMSIIDKISAELVDLKFNGRVHFTGINEPLIDKRIFEIISRFKNIAAKKSMTTNGDYLNEESLSKLKDSGLTHLNISIYSDDHYDKIKQSCFGWNYGIVDMRPNHERLYNVLSNRAGSLDLSGLIGNELVQIKNKLSKDKGCSRPFQYTTIIHTGEVILCPEDMYASCIMGDLNKNSLLEIWNNEKFLHYRETLKKEGRKNLNPCQNCNFSGRKTKEKGKELHRI
jgi:radical SAM protein with 4Fe4S-binding SPASM domain